MIASVWTSGLAAIGTSFGVTVVLTREVLELLRRHRILDRPNERSMHANATPRGGGIAVMAAVLLVWGGLAVVPGPLSAWAWVGIGGALC